MRLRHLQRQGIAFDFTTFRCFGSSLITDSAAAADEDFYLPQIYRLILFIYFTAYCTCICHTTAQIDRLASKHYVLFFTSQSPLLRASLISTGPPRRLPALGTTVLDDRATSRVARRADFRGFD